MRKSLVLMVVLGLVVGAIATPAGAKKRKKPVKIERTATAVYDTPAPGVAGNVAGGNCGSPSTGCTKFTASTGETFASFTIKDASGLPATGAIWIGSDNVVGVFCGSTESPIAVTPGIEYTVWVHNGPATDNACPGVATSGTVEALFTNYQ